MKKIIKDKNESRIKTKSKILVLGLILIALVGLFGPTNKAQAIDCTSVSNGKALPAGCTVPPGSCFDRGSNPISDLTWQQCMINPGYKWMPPGQTPSGPVVAPSAGGLAPGTVQRVTATAAGTGNSTLYDNLNSCGVVWGTLAGCLVTLAYYIFYGLPAFLLTVAARFFDIILALALSSNLYGSFIAEAWAVVRDLSNIFFILILLYIGIKIILGLGGSEVKKMIARVIIMALLINFSMFFTKIIIDTSNILALIFYNKINVEAVKDGVPQKINYIAATTATGEKDVAGGLVSRFDPSKLLTQDFFTNVKKTTHEFSATSFAAYVGSGALIGTWIPIPGVGTGVGAVAGAVGYFLSSGDTAVPVPLMLGIIAISGGIMLFATYAFLVAGVAFVSRLIELWVLIIASPFAFMSSTIPLLEAIPHVGWKEWLKRLFQVSFMAPIFMFFLYLIFKIVQADPIGKLAARTPAQQGWMETMLLLIIPAMIILILLIKATSFAKKWSGELGDVMMKGVAIAGGIAGGLAIGGTAMALQASLGRAGSMVANSAWAKRMETRGRFGTGALAGGLRGISKYAATSSFDARKGIAGAAIGAASSLTGLDFGAKSKLLIKPDGGYEADRKRMVEKRVKRAEELKMGEDERLKQDLNVAEEKARKVKLEFEIPLETVDKEIAKAREEMNDAKNANDFGALEEWKTKLNDAKERKRVIREDSVGTDGITVKDAESEVRTITYNIKVRNAERMGTYADNIEGGIIKRGFRMFGLQEAGDNADSRREAAHKIIMEEKLDSGEKGK